MVAVDDSKNEDSSQDNSESSETETTEETNYKSKLMSNITKEVKDGARKLVQVYCCKRALAETNGDLEEAVSILRRRVSHLLRKAGRDASEGIIANAVAQINKKAF